ncbi:MAG: HAD-IA family hydrolase [Elusimicrobiota bacterium]|nr:HAD-IA family hydrolase [Elusimicrobiota bacterium]
MKYNLLIFDLDGTLIDSQKDLATAVNLTRQWLGLKPLAVDEIRSFVGNGLKVLLQKSLPEIQGNNFEAAFAKMDEYYQEHLFDETFMYDGVLEMLKHFADVKKAVLTNKPEKFTRGLLKHFGIENYFAQIVGGDTLAFRKPDPRTILEIISQTYVAKAQTIMIGDGVNDIKAADGAQIDSVFCLYGYTNPELVSQLKPKFFIKAPKDLISVLS